MDDAGKYEHALTAVLYALKKKGVDLGSILESAKQGMIDNSIRPRPQDQQVVADTIAQAISDIDTPGSLARPRRPEDIPMPKQKPGPIVGDERNTMKCPDCNNGTRANGEDCELCQGTGRIQKY